MFCYYLLEGDTVVLNGLYARLCHTFLVFCSFLNNRSENNYLRIHVWTNFHIFHQTIDICTQMNDLDLFPIRQGTLQWQPIFGKIGKITIRQAGIPKRVEIYGSFDSKIFNGNIVGTSCANLIKIGPITPEIARVTTAPFWTRQQKSAHLIKYLGKYQTDLQEHFSVDRHMYEDY